MARFVWKSQRTCRGRRTTYEDLNLRRCEIGEGSGEESEGRAKRLKTSSDKSTTDEHQSDQRSRENILLRTILG